MSCQWSPRNQWGRKRSDSGPAVDPEDHLGMHGNCERRKIQREPRGHVLAGLRPLGGMECLTGPANLELRFPTPGTKADGVPPTSCARPARTSTASSTTSLPTSPSPAP